MEKSHLWPYFLPDGRHFLYTIVSKIRSNSGIFVGSLDSPSRKQLLADPSRASFVNTASGTGLLVFIHNGRLTAQRFDPGKMELRGESVPIGDVPYDPDFWADGNFGVSDGGVLVFQGLPNSRLKRLTWFDRTGKVMGSVVDPVLITEFGLNSTLALSPDGKRVALARIDPKSESYFQGATDTLGRSHIWLIDLSRGVDTRLTAHPTDDASEYTPIWSADGKRLIFGSTREGGNDLFWKDVDGGGPEELLVKSGSINWASRGLAVALPTAGSSLTRRILLLTNE
jgi:dipeptidyl aminopeptidase/acylaminoacyl peptidase